MPLQFAWKDLRTDFFEFDAGHGYDRSMASMFRIFFLTMFFRKSGLLSNTTPRFLADADGYVSYPRFKHGEKLKNFSH